MDASSSLLLAPRLPEGSDVPLDECFAIDDAPARAVDCVSWGPHNVLQVCSRWSVSFYLSNLLAPAQQRQIRHHPLCHRLDVESMEVVVGAKWSPSLLPEVYYPATARLCVQTTSNLVVYRVTRHGTSRVTVSCGLGVVCCRGSVNSPGAADTSAAVSTKKPLVSAGTTPAESVAVPNEGGPTAAPRKRRAPAQTKTKASSSPPPKKKAATAAARGRGRPPGRRAKKPSSDDEDSTSSSSSSSSSSSFSSSSDSSTDSSGEDVSSDSSGDSDVEVIERGARSAAQKDKSAEEDETPLASLFTSKSETQRSPTRATTTAKETNGKLHSGSATNAAIVDYMWLSMDDLLVLTTDGVHVLSFYGDLSDDDAPQMRTLPAALYTWKAEEESAAFGASGPTPTCLSAISIVGLPSQTPVSTLRFLQRTVVVASPYLLRVLHIASSASAHDPSSISPYHVQPVQFVEVPQLQSVPMCMCAVAVSSSSTPEATSSTSTPSPCADGAVDVVAFVAAPLRVLRGSFTVTFPVSTTGAAPAPQTHRCTLWKADAEFGADQLVGEVSLRGLVVAPFASAAAATVGSSRSIGDDRPSTSSAASSTVVSTSVLGIGERSLVQFLLSGPSCAGLFYGPLLVGRSEMPARTCAGVSGVALHPSGAVAVMLLQSGHAGLDPLHLCPVSADGPRSWLRRFVELAGLLRDAAAPGDAEDPWAPTSNGSAEDRGAGAHTPSRGPLRYTKHLAQYNLSDSYFMRERLLPGAAAQSADLHSYSHALQEARQLPSNELLQQWRAARQRRRRAALPSSPVAAIPDLPLRHAYLQLRTRHGVALFLRWPAPLSHGHDADLSGSAVVAAEAAMEAQTTSWPWWRLLRHIWSSCPWDTPVLRELILARAVLILAKRFRYANMTFTAAERYRERTPPTSATAATPAAVAEPADRCSTDPDVVDIDGARSYVAAYVRHQEQLLEQLHAAEKDSASASREWTSGVLSATDCEPTSVAENGTGGFGQGRDAAQKLSQPSDAPQPHWPVSPAWVTALKEFLQIVSPTSLGKTDALPSSDGAADVLFPCSLCDRDNVAAFKLALSTVSTHVPLTAGADAALPVAHTTLFSGTTFCPLSFFSTEYVLTRCLSCGLSDYADGPLCRVCGGLLE